MEKAIPSETTRRSIRLLTGGTLLLITVFGLLNNYQSVVMNRVVETYGLIGGAQGIMSSMINIGSIAAFLSAPALQGRLKKTSMLLIACLLLVVSFFMLGSARVYAAMLAGSLLAGVGFGWVDSNCNALMVDLHPFDSSRKLGLLHGGFGVGGLAAPLVITALFAATDWHGVSYVLCALIAAAGIVFLLLTARAAKGAPAAKPEQKLTFSAVKEFLLRRKNALMLLTAMLYAATQSGLVIWIVRYMTLQYGAETLGSAALSIYWISATLSRFFAPYVPMRPLKLFLLGTAVSSVLLIVGVLSGSAVVMCVMVGGIGLVSGHCIPMLISEASASEPGNSALVASSFLVSMCLVRVIIPVFMGFLAAKINLAFMMLSPAVFGVLATLVCVVILLGERRQKTPVPAA